MAALCGKIPWEEKVSTYHMIIRASKLVLSAAEFYLIAAPFILTALLLYQAIRFFRLLLELSGKKREGRFYDIVDGYELEVSWQWTELTEGQRDAMTNGIGSASWPSVVRNILDASTEFLGPSAPHDVDYTVYRTSDERLIADQRFFRNCVRVLLQDAGGWKGLFIILFVNFSKAKYLFHRLLKARALYRALRLGGLMAFNAASKVDFVIRGGNATKFTPLVEGGTDGSTGTGNGFTMF